MGKVIGKRGATIHVRFHGMSVTIPGFLQNIIIGISEQPSPDNFQNRKNEQGSQMHNFSHHRKLAKSQDMKTISKLERDFIGGSLDSSSLYKTVRWQEFKIGEGAYNNRVPLMALILSCNHELRVV